MAKTTAKAKLLSIQALVIPDDNPDTSTLGEYTDTPSDWVILRSAGEYVHDLPEDTEIPERGRECRFFKPYAGGETPGTEDYKVYGKQDFERMEALERQEWAYVGIQALAKVQLPSGTVQRITSGGLWGIESDSGQDYFAEVAGDEMAQLADDLKALGISAKAITAAVKAATQAGLIDG